MAPRGLRRRTARPCWPLLVVALCACGDDTKPTDAAVPPADGELPDGGVSAGEQDAEPSWGPESTIDAESCLLDLDCDAEQHCALGVCTSECGSGAPCPRGEVCSARGQCIEERTEHRMEPPPRVREGELTVSSALLRFAPRITRQTITMTVSDLDPGAELRYRLAATNELLVLPGTEIVRLEADAAGTVEEEIVVEIDPARVDATRGSSTLRIVTDAGTAVIPVVVVADVFGQYTGSLSVTAPWAYGSFPFAFEVWPGEGTSDVKVVVYPEDNLLFFDEHVVRGSYDATMRRLVFAFDTVVHHDSIDGTGITGPAPPPTLDLLASDLEDRVDWRTPRPESVGNALRRYIGREIQVSLTFDDGGELRGQYVEVLHGAVAREVTIRGGVRASRSLSHEGLIELRDEDGEEPFEYVPPAYGGTLDPGARPVFPGAPDRPDVAIACGGVLADVPACTGITRGSLSGDLNECGEEAFASAFGLGEELSAATGDSAGDAYRQAYVRCGGLADPDGTRQLGPPDLASLGCVDQAKLTCAFAAFDASIAGMAAPFEQLRGYEGVFRVMRAAAQAYAFLGNEYVVSSVRAPLRGVTGRGSLEHEAEALAYAAHSFYLALSILTQPVLLEELQSAPGEIMGVESETRSMRLVFLSTLREVLTSLARALSVSADAVVAEARLYWDEGGGDVDGDATQFLKRIGFAGYLDGAILGQALQDRGLGNAPGLADVRSSLGQVVSQFSARLNGLNPLGYDPSFVPVVQRERGDPETSSNFEILEDRYSVTSSVSWLRTAEREYRAFEAVLDSWNAGEAQLRREITDRVEGYDSELETICDVAPPENPAFGRGEPRVPTEAERVAYGEAVDAYLGRCITADGGQISSAIGQVAQAFVQTQIADERMRQLEALVAIETQRVARITDIRNEFLTYRLDDERQLTALQLAEFDIRRRELERERSSGLFGGLLEGLGTIAAGVLTGGVGLAAAAAAAASTIEDHVEYLISPDGLVDVAGIAIEADSDLAANAERRDLAARRGEIRLRQHMRAVEEAVQMDVANSQATVQSYLVRMAELGLEADLAGLRLEEAQIGLANLLSRLSSQLSRRDATIDRLVFDEDGILVDPTFRIEADESALAYRGAFRNAQAEAFELLRALEYEINADTGFAGDVFAANNPDDLIALHETFSRTLDCYGREVGGFDSGFETVVSLRRDVYGIDGPMADPLTGEIIDTGEQLRRSLLNHDTLDDRGLVLAIFETDLTINEVSGFAVSSTTRCNEQIRSLEVQLVGDRLGADQAAVQIRQRGTGLLRSCASAVGTSLADDLVEGYDLSGFNPATASLQAGVNAWSGTTSTALAYRPVANTRWELVIDPADPANRDLDVTRIDDVLVRMTSAARALPPGGIPFRADRCR